MPDLIPAFNELRSALDTTSQPKDFRNKIVAAFPVKGKEDNIMVVAECGRIFILTEDSGSFLIEEMEVRHP